MLFQKNRLVNGILFNSNFIFIFFVSLCYIRTVESQNNDSYAGTLTQSYMREYPSSPFYPDGVGKMLKTPIDSLPTGSLVNCTDPLPSGTYPLPRCISDQFAYDLYNFTPDFVQQQSDLRSQRRTSHMTTFFGQYISFDIASSKNTIPFTSLYIPADDATFNPPNSIPGELPAQGIKSLPFNLSQTLPGTPDSFNSVRNGVSGVTPLLDLNTIYGTSDDQLATLRDGNGTSCKLLTSNNGKYPSRDTDGLYRWGTSAKRSWSLFTLAINTVWIREHNRLCGELFKVHGNSWNDQQYFDEARRWNVAYFQKATSEEYLGTILGRPLPVYEGYDPNLVPGIDTFFATVTFRYGHTELSDIYRIQDEYGNTIADLTLDQIGNQDLVEIFGLYRVLNSIALQRQEEINMFFSDATRNFISSEPNTYDIPAFDISRSRDRGIPLYNVVREAYGLPRKNTWDEITNDKYVQYKLQLLYPNGPDTVEAYVGAFCEDHLGGSNFGELLNASIVTQFDRVRRTDKNWWESPERFSDAERVILRNTTFQAIIARNFEIDGVDGSQFVQSIWTVLPNTKLQDGDDAGYPNKAGAWSSYSIKYRVDQTHIYFKVELQTAEGQGWFGMGFDPSDNGMRDAEFIVGIVRNNDIDLSYYHAAVGGYHPPVRESPNGLIITSKNVASDGTATIEFNRPLTSSNHKPIRNAQMKYIMAYNPTSGEFSYHGGNRVSSTINFFTNEISSADVTGSQKSTRIFHGVGMFLTWCVLFPISIFIVRFRKHTDNYLRIHRTIQLLGGISVSTFGAAAMATVSTNRSPHAWVGLVIYALVFLELGLGLFSIYGLAAIVSVNQGYPRLAKRTHKVFGAILLLVALANIYLGIDTFTQLYSVPSLGLKISYAVWTFILILMFIVGEYLWRRKGSYSKLREEDPESNKRNSELYNDNDKSDLPDFTWEEVNERVQRGAFLLVCDGYVVDIRRWVGIHPGGTQILEKAIGTDITNDFHNTHKKLSIIEEVPETLLSVRKEDNASVSALEKYDNVLDEKYNNILGEKYDSDLSPKRNFSIKNLTPARLIDKINLKHFSTSLLANHNHSAFATKKMLEMVIGKIINQTEQTTSPISPTFDTKPKYFGDDETTQRIKFRRYKLTSRTTVNTSKNNPVVKFTFTKVYQDEKDVWDEGFLPGHYIEVQSHVEGQVVVRSYTPVEGKLSKSFSIYVKIYPNGLMSTHLNEQLTGSEIKVRGPFDVSDRFKLSSFNQGEALNRSLYIPHSLVKSGSSLINPNSLDGCWDELFMICGGTGVTPMLQLIKYHLFHIKKRKDAGQGNKIIHMHLLYGNKGIEDVIDAKQLKEYESSSRRMLEIKFVFPDDSLQRSFTLAKLRKWFDDIKAKKPSSDIHDDNSFKHPQSKIVVCGPPDMVLAVDKILTEMGYSDNDYISLL